MLRFANPVLLASIQPVVDPAAIAALAGTPKKTVERYVSNFEVGKTEASFDAYYGIDLGPAGVCKLLGAWTARYGSSGG